MHPTDVTLRNIHYTAGDGTRVFWDGGNNISFIGGEIGPTDLTGDGQEPMYFQGDNAPAGSVLNNLLISGMYIHNNRQTIDSPHIEQIRLDSGINNVTISGSRFENNTDDTSTIFVTHAIAGSTQPTNVTIENNFFGQTDLGQPGIKTNDPVLTNCSNLRIAYNTARASLFTSACSTWTGAVITSNIGPKQGGFCPGGSGVYSHNVWINNLSANCGAGDTTFSSLAAVLLGGFDGFHLTAGSPAIGHGNPTDCPALDYDGDARPMPAATTCDAGADEVNQ